jgi:hypothetical protein
MGMSIEKKEWFKFIEEFRGFRRVCKFRYHQFSALSLTCSEQRNNEDSVLQYKQN